MLNEASGIANFLQSNLPRLPKGTEVILVDGGSADASKAITAGFPVQLLESQRGRARQMNAGAESAAGQYLLFLHADTQLNQNFSEQFEQWVATDPVWGFSPVRLDGTQLWCRIVEFSINLRTRITSGASGDQGIVLQADKFRELGGYREIDLMEDIDLSYRLRRQSKPRRFAQPVTTSNRRWVEGGVVRTVVMMWFLRLSFRLGVAPRRLARIYSGV
jgi:rSAM/selenodomain-associated transferase 2